MWKSYKHLVLAAALLANTAADSFAQEAELLAVLRSDATLQDKSAACRQLARIATKEAVPTLAALLGDEKLSHMARYALETIRDPSVDDALRDALGKVQGLPRLGVIGSLGARRDAKAVDALAGLLKGTDAAQPKDRHLLLLVREGREKQKFLCGHDERHWFVAAIPESAPVGTVRQAKESLKPAEVQLAQARKRVGGKARNRRKNAAFIRQGEWFFVPVPNMVIDQALVLKNEPLSRGNGGKPHWAEFCYRTGGETVYVCSRHPNGVTEARYHTILASNARAKNWGWQTMQRNPGVYVRGRIRHPDHKTITLHGWHRVVMNTENQSRAMRNVAFLD